MCVCVCVCVCDQICSRDEATLRRRRRRSSVSLTYRQRKRGLFSSLKGLDNLTKRGRDKRPSVSQVRTWKCTHTHTSLIINMVSLCILCARAYSVHERDCWIKYIMRARETGDKFLVCLRTLGPKSLILILKCANVYILNTHAT